MNKKNNICACALFAFTVQVLLTNMSQKFTHFVWKIFARQSLPSKNFWLFGSRHCNTHKPISVCVFCILVRGHQIIILPIWIIMSHHAWGNSVSIYVIFHMKIPLPFLDQHFPHFLVLKKKWPYTAHRAVVRSVSSYKWCTDYARVCQSMPEYARVYQSMPENARGCQSMQ